MFVWNMLGALILIPALAYFLLPRSVFQKAARHAIIPETTKTTPRNITIQQRFRA
jgi:hypothetical protein